MAGFFVAGKINYGVKYGGLAEKPPHFTLPSTYNIGGEN